MKRLVKVTVDALIEVDNEGEVEEVIGDIVHSADWDVDMYEWQDFGEYKE